ncbi:MAG: NFACT family protein [Candidatus Micrarchaeota archaeon]
MHRMSSLEYSFLADELARGLAGRHFNRIRKLKEGLYRMKIGSSEIICELGVRIHFTRYIEEAKEADKFAEKLDKELDNAKLRQVRQLAGDRILSFDFESGEGESSLIFEMFGEGNAILARGGKIICAAKYESWSDREIKAGAEYRTPKTAPSEKLEAGPKYIIVSLMKLPLGKDYALEALARCGIGEKTPGSALSGNKLMELERAISGIRESAKPVGFFENGKMKDFALAPLSKYATLENRAFASLSEAADEYYSKVEEENPELEKLEERLKKQKERLSALADEEAASRALGDLIYANYAKAEEALALAKAGKFDELEKKFAAKIDRKEKKMEFEL